MASDAESDSASISSNESFHLVSPLVSTENLKYPDSWMLQGNPGESRDYYPPTFSNGLNNMGLATESFIDTCCAIATQLEITNQVSPSILRVVDRQTRLFPSNLHLNKGYETIQEVQFLMAYYMISLLLLYV
jgi:hypothetical protein